MSTRNPQIARWLHVTALVVPLMLIFVFGILPFDAESYLPWNNFLFRCIADRPDGSSDFTCHFSTVYGTYSGFGVSYALSLIFYVGVVTSSHFLQHLV